jgi:hypothetical protein
MQINSLESEWTSAQNIKPRRETVTLAIGLASPHTILKKLGSVGQQVCSGPKQSIACVRGLTALMQTCSREQELGFTAVVIDWKGDWPELSSGMGLPSHASAHAPCMLCSCSKLQLRDHSLHNPLLPFGANSYHDECLKHEMWICIENRDVHRKIRWGLEWRSKHRGRALSIDVPECGLLKKDRIEPTLQMFDVQEFDNIDTFPCLVLFWRPKPGKERTYHRHPCFCEELGIGLETLSLDSLHCVHLGIMKSFVGKVIWSCLCSNIYEFRLSRQDDLIAFGLQQFCQDLHRWYPGRSNIVSFCFPTPAPRAKAFETNVMLCFLPQGTQISATSLGSLRVQLLVWARSRLE